MNSRFLVLAGSIVSLGMLAPLAEAQVPAFNAVSGLTGNTATTNSFGSTFDVVSPISITQLAAFDSGNDGFPPSGPVTISIYNRDTMTAVASITFTNLNHGTLLAGSSFRVLNLSSPVTLGGGFHGEVVGDFPSNDPVDVNAPQYTTNTNGGLISFPTTSGGIGTIGTYPATQNTNTYLAGSFVFTAASVTPEPGTVGLMIGLSGAGLGALLRRRRRLRK